MRTIEQLYRYPVKGLSGESLTSVDLERGRAFPEDRVYAITNDRCRLEEGSLEPEPKTSFLVLMKYAQLAQLATQYDAVSKVLEIRDHISQQLLVSACLDTESGRDHIGAFFQSFLGEQELKNTPRVVYRKDHPFTDVSVVSPTLMHSVSLINLASLRALEKALGEKLDPRRFRANIYFEGQYPWEEFEWLDKEISMGDIRAKVNFKTRRCPATDVNPETAERDLKIPQALRQHYGHGDLGVYAEILTPGTLNVGHRLTPPET